MGQRTEAIKGKDAEKVTPEVALRGAETILLAEDEPSVRKLVRDALTRQGYRVLEAHNGAHAVEVAARHHGEINLLVTDVIMPELNGPEVAKRVVQSRPNTRVLYMSGYTDTVVIDQGVSQFSQAGFLQKPFTVKELVGKVSAVLSLPVEKSRILIVDDEPEVRKVLRAMLQSNGYEVLEAADGAEVGELLGSGVIHVLITDLVMPEREGIETIMAARRDHPDLKIIAMSGAAGGSYLKRAKGLGADATLAKPLRSHTVLQTVQQLIKA